MNEPITICVLCRHFISKGDRWYLMLCGASPRPEGIDPVTGDKGYVISNDLGRVVITDEKFRHARDVNDGACTLWEAI